VEDQARNEKSRRTSESLAPVLLNADAVKVSRVWQNCAYLTWRHDVSTFLALAIHLRTVSQMKAGRVTP
jgi:hypothetical protein